MEVDELSGKVPEQYRERFLEIVNLTDRFCDQHLNDEYRATCRLMAASVCRAGLPVLRGKAASWACGVVYAVGWVNFLTDREQTPHMKAEEIAAGFGVSTATMHVKHREIRDRLELMPLDPTFTVASHRADNPLVWLVEVNGFLIDMRDVPREVQELAVQKGLIPCMPPEREAES